jgi:hypothetical protein
MPAENDPAEPNALMQSLAIDLLVDAQQHRAKHPVGDHLVEALIGEVAD